MESTVYFLLAAAIGVTLFKKAGLGAVLGYLVAGIVIGPDLLGLIKDPERVLHTAEIGVIFLLFVIGLEIEPPKLWSMRKQVFVIGLAQFVISAVLIYCLLRYSFDLKHNASTVIALSLSLSSTAFAIQLMSDRKMLGLEDGRKGFGILLLQDLAVVPILFVVQALSPVHELSDSTPWWIAPLAVFGLVGAARFLINPLLNYISKHGGREMMTVVALLIVLGAAYLMDLANLSAGLGAFMAGMMLANSKFRHQLEADIEPFKGLGLGLFFIAIGMTLDLKLLMRDPLLVIMLTLLLMVLKVAVIAVIVKAMGAPWMRGVRLGLLLSQGGEFAFVVLAQASLNGILNEAISGTTTLVVGLSMALTVPLLVLWERYMDFRQVRAIDKKSTVVDDSPEVIILGFGRFGQVTGRILAANGIPFTALDKNAEHIEFVKRFGSRVYYGDASRIEVLEAAGVAKARTVVIALDDPLAVQTVARELLQSNPKLRLIARAHNRTDFLALRSLGVHVVLREVFDSALEAASQTLQSLGYSDGQAMKATELFRQHDQRLLEEQSKVQGDTEKIIELGIQGREELESLFKRDKEAAETGRGS